MRRIFFALFCLLFALSPLYADNITKVHLQESRQPMKIISEDNLYDLTVEMGRQDENRTAVISISLENYSQTESLFVFFDEYSESRLKRNNPRIVYDKYFGGNKGGRFTKYPDPILSGIKSGETGLYYEFLPGSEKRTLYSGIHMKDGGQKTFKIPIFIARKKKFLFWSWYVLMEQLVNVLEVSVELDPDVRYLELGQAIDHMALRVSQDTIHFCKHTGNPHYPSVEQQQSAWKERIDSLRRVVATELEIRNVSVGSEVDKDFAKLQTRISEINLDIIPQVEHKLPNTCNCQARIRNLSLEKIYNKLDDYNQQIYNKKIKKEDVIKEVRALKLHSTHIQKDPKGYKKGINKIYNKIVSG